MLHEQEIPFHNEKEQQKNVVAVAGSPKRNDSKLPEKLTTTVENRTSDSFQERDEMNRTMKPRRRETTSNSKV